MSPEAAIAAVFALAAIEAATGSSATDNARTKAMIVRAKRIIMPSDAEYIVPLNSSVKMWFAPSFGRAHASFIVRMRCMVA